MSRSKHTDPLPIRARRRLVSPWERRSAGDLSQRQKTGRTLKESGVNARPILKAVEGRPVRPRIILQPPRSGFFHPAGPSDVLTILEFIGPEAVYGLQSIEFLRATETRRLYSLGQLEIPGRIIVYEQALTPWHISGIIGEEDVRKFRRSGADVEYRESPKATIINWPEDSLREFILLDVFVHEVGHHILQHNKGKRLQRIARTRDHELYAAELVEKCRKDWVGSA